MNFCENRAADSVVGYYCALAKREGVPFCAKLDLPQVLPVDDIDLCLVLSNLLELSLIHICYHDQESFFEAARCEPLTNAVIALPGVDGLNAVEHLRALCPQTRIIWRSDLDSDQ